MKIIDNRCISFDVDDEDPKCICCEHFGDNFDCCKSCGAEHSWNGYVRYIYLKRKQE